MKVLLHDFVHVKKFYLAPMHLVQLSHPQAGRKVALVDEPNITILHKYPSIYEMALDALARKVTLSVLIEDCLSNVTIPYDGIYLGKSSWNLLPAFDHPTDPMHCLVAGTGLTHRSSAANRNAMHETAPKNETDSMRMYKWGEESGKPQDGQIGVQPEWFYKGTGSILSAHNQPLEVPPYADDGGEEPEVAGAYVIDDCGIPWRVGYAAGNEFSDHVMEKKNYLYLAPSKLRQCAIGPELVVDESFEDLVGTIKIERAHQTIWSADLASGEKAMVHSIANMEYHHFKYEQHRIPGQAHVHFFGADDFSFGHEITLHDGDWMDIHWQGLGRPLRNPLRISTIGEKMISIQPLG